MMIRNTTRRLMMAQRTTRMFSSETEDIQLLEQLLENLRTREKSQGEGSASSGGAYSGPAFNIKTFNNISSKGLTRFQSGFYKVGS